MNIKPLQIGWALGLIWALLMLLTLSDLAHADEGADVRDNPRLDTTIVGERETAVGLLIAPWKEEHASTMDRPPRLFDVPFAPVDANAFRTGVQVREDVSSLRRSR